jgi:hypothetical protein
MPAIVMSFEEQAVKDFVPLLQTGLWVVLVVAALLIFHRDVAAFREAWTDRLRNGGAVEIGFVKLGEIRAELGMVENRVNAVSDTVASLFLITMSAGMFKNLGKIGSGHFGTYEMSDALRRELGHLRNLGYIDVYAIRDIPPQGEELSQYVTITEAGREFVRLRKSVSGPDQSR